MQIKETVDKTSGVTTFTISGDLDFKELINFIVTFYEESELIKGYLWDFRGIKSVETMSFSQMGRLFKLCRKYFYRYPAQKVSVLVGENLDFGFAQVMSTFEQLYDVYLNVKVFQDHEGAMEWALNKSSADCVM